MKKLLFIFLLVGSFAHGQMILDSYKFATETIYFSDNAASPTPNEAATTTGWTEIGSETGSQTVGVEPTDVQNGDDAILVTCTSDFTTSGTGIELALSNLDSSKTYDVTGYLKCTGTVNITARLNSADGWGSTVSQFVTNPTTFTQFTLSASPTGTTAAIEIYSNVSFDNTNTYIVDNIVVAEQ